MDRGCPWLRASSRSLHCGWGVFAPGRSRGVSPRDLPPLPLSPASTPWAAPPTIVVVVRKFTTSSPRWIWWKAFALASVHHIDFLVTWNFKHIANPHIRERMRTKINDSGYRMPVMCSPEELLNEDEAI